GDFRLQPADLAAEVVERQLDGVLHVLADDALGARQRGDEADLQRFSRAGLAREASGDEEQDDGDSGCAHDGLLRWRAILAQFTALAPTIGRWHRQAQIADLPAADAVGNGQVAEPRLRLPEGVERPGIPSARAAPSGPNER